MMESIIDQCLFDHVNQNQINPDTEPLSEDKSVGTLSWIRVSDDVSV